MQQIGLLNACVMVDEIEIKIRDDLERTLALEAFTERRDVLPLAKLLRSGKAPSEIAREISIFLDPPEGYRGPTLQPKFPARSRSSEGFYQRLLEKRKVRQKILEALEAQGTGQLEAAISKVMEETKLSRAALFEAYGWDDKKIVQQRLLFIGYGKSKESEESRQN